MSKSKINSIPENYVRLEGSERHPSSTAQLIGAADENETFSVTIVLRRRPDGEPVPDYDYFLKTPPGQRRRLPENEFASKYGAHPDDIQKVVVFAQSQGLNIIETGAAQRHVIVSGSVAQMSNAFAVKLGRYQHEITIKGPETKRTEIYRGRDGHIYIPKELAGIIIGVFGLDNRNITKIGGGDPAGTTTITIPDVRGRYNFPANSAAGQTIAVFCGYTDLGDGYDINDIKAYFAGLPAEYPMPNIAEINVHGSNSGSDPFGELTQDIDIAGTAAPGADLAVYFTTHSQLGWHDSLSRIIHPQGTDVPCSVLTSSYYVSNGDDAGGIAETSGASLAWIVAVDLLFQDAAIQGVTMCMCSGDNGTDARVGDGKAHVWFPSSDPWALSVGGTTVGPYNGSSFEEFVWNDDTGATGGGVSDYFLTVPSYQSNVNYPMSVNDGHTGRSVPDVAANASPSSGYPITIGGLPTVANGTSSSTPLWAGLIAVINAAIGENVGFVNPAIYEIGSGAFRDIVGAPGPADNGFSGVPGYPAGTGWDACTGWGSPNGVALLNALQTLYHQSFYFIVDKSTYGMDEVSDVISSPSNGKFPNAFWLVLEGFSINQVNNAVPSIFGAFTGVAGVTITSDGPAEYEFAGDQFIPQRIRFPFDVTFTSTNGFPPAGSASLPELLEASITIQGTTLSAETLFELVTGADPYFTNLDPANNNDVFYLSQDLRVFSAAAGDHPVPGGPQVTGDPYASIQNLLGYLNSTAAYTVPGSSDPLNSLPGQTGYETADSSVTPKNSANQQNYNFAIARVRLQDTAALASAENVRVFFRLFVAQSCDTDFQPATTYKSTPGTAGNDLNKPVFPLPSGSGLTDPSGNSIQTIPFFATDAAGTHDYDGSLMNANIRTIQIPLNQDKIWAYYGCFLDVYDSNNQSKFGGTHHCIVAEIAYDDTPLTNSNGVTWSPENSDKLAQRNLQITSSGNPSYPATHHIPQAFDMRPSAPLSAETGLLLDYPDELMIDWGNTPVGSIANIYWPQVDTAEILQLASKLYGTNLLSAADAHTIKCQVTKGVTYIPIPVDTGKNFAGLFTLDLPNGITIGQEFNVKVRRVTSRKPVQTNVKNTSTEAVGSKRNFMINWRYITGTFQVKIPVASDEALLFPEENTLAVLKWRLQHMKAINRWYPVLERYIAAVAIRVNGFGGDAAAIKPSLNGAPAKLKPILEGTTEYRGKVTEVIYNCFGDLEGFALGACCSDPHIFKCNEKSVGELVSRACKERWTVAVYVKERSEGKICGIRIYP